MFNDNTPVNELSIYFTLPGYDNIDLIEKGSETLLTL